MAFDGTKPEYQAPILSQPLRDNFAALKTQLDAEHNENGTHKDALKKSGDTSTGDQNIKKSAPAIRLIGTETNAKDLRLVETAGSFKIQRNLGTEASPAWTDTFALDTTTNRITVGKITQDNLDSSTQIPDGRLAQITTANKVADSALSSNIPKLSALNTYSAAQTVQGSDAAWYAENNTDTTYKAAFKKDSDTTAKILLKNRSDGSDAAIFAFGADGNFTTKNVTAQQQLVSQVATGTPPLAVNSSTVVPNLNCQYWNGQSIATNWTGSTVPTLSQDFSGVRTVNLGWLASYTFSWFNHWNVSTLTGWHGATSATVTWSGATNATAYEVYGTSWLRQNTTAGVPAGTYTVSQVIQALVTASHTHTYTGAVTASVCNCNCNCNCTS